MVVSRSSKDGNLFREKLRFDRDTIALHSENILGVEVDSCLRVNHHLMKVAFTASRRVTVMRRLSHLDADSLKTIYKAQARLVMEYSPLT